MKGSGGCLVLVVALVACMALAGVMFDYTIRALFGWDVHWLADTLCGVFTGPVMVPAFFVTIILRASGMQTPFLS